MLINSTVLVSTVLTCEQPQSTAFCCANFDWWTSSYKQGFPKKWTKIYVCTHSLSYHSFTKEIPHPAVSFTPCILPENLCSRKKFLCLSDPLVKAPHFCRLLCWMGVARYSRNYSGCLSFRLYLAEQGKVSGGSRNSVVIIHQVLVSVSADIPTCKITLLPKSIKLIILFCEVLSTVEKTT